MAACSSRCVLDDVAPVSALFTSVAPPGDGGVDVKAPPEAGSAWVLAAASLARRRELARFSASAVSFLIRDDNDSSCAVVVEVVVDDAVGPPRVLVNVVSCDVRCSRVGKTGRSCGWLSLVAKNGFDPVDTPNAASIRASRVSNDAACSRRPADDDVGDIAVASPGEVLSVDALVSFPDLSADCESAPANLRERRASEDGLDE